MEFKIAFTQIRLKRGDITQEEVDAIVNAANSSLMGGGGVDAAIHRAGGAEILEECREIVNRQGSCNPGQAVLTSGGALAARFVVHTVGPIWKGGDNGEQHVLRSAYMRSLELAADAGAKSIAFPSISTGAYRYPVDLACEVALISCREYAREKNSFDEIRFILFSDADLKVYAIRAAQLFV